MFKSLLAAGAVLAGLSGAAHAADTWYTDGELSRLSPHVRDNGGYYVHPDADVGTSAAHAFGAGNARDGKWYTSDELKSVSPRIRDGGAYYVEPEAGASVSAGYGFGAGTTADEGSRTIADTNRLFPR